MALAAVKEFHNNNQTPGTAVQSAHFNGVNDSAGGLKYLDIGGGDIVISSADATAAAAAMIIITTQGDTKFIQHSYLLKFVSLPSATLEHWQFRNSSGKIGSWAIGFSGAVPTLSLRAGGDVSVLTATCALDVWYLVQSAHQADTTTTGKTRGLVTRVSDSVVVGTGELTTANNGTTNLTIMQGGKVPASGTVNLQMDNIAVNDAAYALIPAAVPPPIMSPEVVSARAVVDVRDTLYAPTGTYALTHVSGPNNASTAQQPSPGLFLVPQGATPSTYTVTVTQGSKTTSSTVTVPAAATGGTPGAIRRRMWNGTAWA